MSTSTRGFASMSKEQRRKIAASGGKRTNELGKGHKWTSKTAQDAAIASHRNRRDRQRSQEVRRWQEIMAHASVYLSEDERVELARLNAELFALIS